MFTTIRQIQAADFDMFRRLTLPAAVRWMEETEYAFLRSRGLSVSLHDALGQLGFPRLQVEVELDRQASPRPGHWLRTELSLQPSSGKQLDYGFQLFLCPDFSSTNAGAVLGSGRFRVACCRFPPHSLPKAIVIPDWILEKLFGACP